MRKYLFLKEYIISKGYDLTNKFNIVFVLYNIILNIFYNEEYKYFILDNPTSKYQDIILYSNIRADEIFECDFLSCEIFGSNEETTNQFYGDNYLLRQQFSSYKLINKRIKAASITGNVVAYVYYTEWRKLFDENICKLFLDFIIRTKEFCQLFFEGKKNYKRQYISDFIKSINDVI